MTQTTSRPGNGGVVNPRLQELLEENRLDWDDPRHRTAYLEHWVNRPIPQGKEEDANE